MKIKKTLNSIDKWLNEWAILLILTGGLIGTEIYNKYVDAKARTNTLNNKIENVSDIQYNPNTNRYKQKSAEEINYALKNKYK